MVLPYISMHLPRVYPCSQSWTPLPPPYPYHPSGSSQCTSPKHPVSCIEPGLAIRFLYDIIHVSSFMWGMDMFWLLLLLVWQLSFLVNQNLYASIFLLLSWISYKRNLQEKLSYKDNCTEKQITLEPHQWSFRNVFTNILVEFPQACHLETPASISLLLHIWFKFL